MRLQHQTSGDLTASDGGHQLFQFGNLADVGALVDKTAHMDRKSAAVNIIRFFTQQVEQLGVAHGDQKVKAIVRVAHNEEQGGFPVSQGVQLQLVVGSDLPQLRNVEHSKARTAGNQDGFCGFASCQLVLFVLADSEMVGLLCLQRVKHQVNGVFELLVILPDLHRIDELDEGGKILFLHRGLIVDIPDKGAVQKRFRLDPEIVPGLALALGIGDQRGDQLQDVLLRVDVGKGVIVHGLLEVNGVEDFDPVRLIDDLAVLILHGFAVLAQLGGASLEHFAALHQDGAFGVCDHIRAVHLHQVRFQPEPGLTGTGAANHQHIFVSGSLGVFGTAVHSQALGFRQNHIVLEHRVDVRSDVLMGSP